MAQLEPYTQEEIDTMRILERGVRDGSSPSETFDGTSGTAIRRVFCAWEARFDVLRYFFGDADTYDDSGTTRLSRLLPQAHPELSEWIAVKLAEPIKGWKWQSYGAAVALDPIDDPVQGEGETDQAYAFRLAESRRYRAYPWDGRVNSFYAAELAIQYEFVNFDVAADDAVESEQDRYVTFSGGDSDSTSITMPGGILKYSVEGGTGDGAAATPKPHKIPIPYGVPYSETEESFELIWRRVPYDAFKPGSPLHTRIYTGDGDTVPYLRCINASEFQGRPIGTVRFEAVKPKLGRKPIGVGWEWEEIRYQFKYRARGWNWLRFFPTGSIDPDTGGMYMVSSDGVYATAEAVGDFKSLHNGRDMGKLFEVG